MAKEKIVEIIERAVMKAKAYSDLKIETVPEITLERPREKAHGDWASNIALVLAGQAKLPPKQVADIIIKYLDDKQHFLEKVEVPPAGFINFYLSKDWLYSGLKEIEQKGTKFGHSSAIKENVLIEFVSANPVGPMHIGHGRWAVVGDVLARVMEAAGYLVTREFYINDFGLQMQIFGKSVAARYSQLLGKDVSFPEDGYQGEYVKDIAREIIKDESDKYLSMSSSERADIFRETAYVEVLDYIKEILSKIEVFFDSWFSESVLHKNGDIEETINFLSEKGYVYHKEGAVWLKTSDFGDDKDRVLVRGNGELTYFAADIAYHRNKLERGFRKLINIWGADHHGYVKRVKAAIKLLGYDKGSLEIIIGQLVNLLRSGEPVRMSKRTGEMVTLDELVDEVGKDAVRFLFLMRNTDSSLDFDIELAKTRTNENPVYYVKYAHARICSIINFAKGQGVPLLTTDRVKLDLLADESELDLIRKMLELEEVVERAASERTPHILTKYALDLATAFHSFYTRCRVVGEDKDLSLSRMVLVNSARVVLANTLSLLGVEAPF
ncbi:MAG: arginine--tRNA ligase [Actinobacteria bacterium]|nr:arginine--tRNA ligase [Actinomycetota bacterium]